MAAVGLQLDHRSDIAVWVSGVFAAVRGVTRGMHAVVRLLEGDITLDAAGSNAALVTLQRLPEPDAGASAPGPHVQLISHADDPDGRVRTQGPVLSIRGDLQLIGGTDPGELGVGPSAHSALAHVVEGGDFLRRETQASCGHVLLEVVDRAGAGDRQHRL